MALDYPILVQGTAPRSQLLKQFRDTPHSRAVRDLELLAGRGRRRRRAELRDHRQAAVRLARRSDHRGAHRGDPRAGRRAVRRISGAAGDPGAAAGAGPAHPSPPATAACWPCSIRACGPKATAAGSSRRCRPRRSCTICYIVEAFFSALTPSDSPSVRRLLSSDGCSLRGPHRRAGPWLVRCLPVTANGGEAVRSGCTARSSRCAAIRSSSRVWPVGPRLRPRHAGHRPPRQAGHARQARRSAHRVRSTGADQDGARSPGRIPRFRRADQQEARRADHRPRARRGGAQDGRERRRRARSSRSSRPRSCRRSPPNRTG